MSEMDSHSYLGGWAGDPLNRGNTYMSDPRRIQTRGQSRATITHWNLSYMLASKPRFRKQFAKKREREQRMGLFIVYEVIEQQSLREGYDRIHSGREPQPSDYTTWYSTGQIGCFHGDTAGDAITAAAKHTKKLGNYVAVEVHPMSIDLTAKQAELTEGTFVEEDE